MGHWKQSDNSTEVAIKTLNPKSTEDDKVRFLQEAAIMGQFIHPNVVMLYGVVTMGEPVGIKLEREAVLFLEGQWSEVSV